MKPRWFNLSSSSDPRWLGVLSSALYLSIEEDLLLLTELAGFRSSLFGVWLPMSDLLFLTGLGLPIISAWPFRKASKASSSVWARLASPEQQSPKMPCMLMASVLQLVCTTPARILSTFCSTYQIESLPAMTKQLTQVWIIAIELYSCWHWRSGTLFLLPEVQSLACHSFKDAGPCSSVVLVWQASLCIVCSDVTSAQSRRQNRRLQNRSYLPLSPALACQQSLVAWSFWLAKSQTECQPCLPVEAVLRGKCASVPRHHQMKHLRSHCSCMDLCGATLQCLHLVKRIVPIHAAPLIWASGMETNLSLVAWAWVNSAHYQCLCFEAGAYWAQCCLNSPCFEQKPVQYSRLSSFSIMDPLWGVFYPSCVPSSLAKTVTAIHNRSARMTGCSTAISQAVPQP